MAAAPWLTLIGVGEDGPEGLAEASRKALEAAELIFGGARHLALLGLEGDPRARLWPSPFSVEPLLAERGRALAVLASGDPFHYGVGSILAARLAPQEWRAFSAPSSFALAAARLGWPLDSTVTLGLHAAPLTRLRPLLARGVRFICLLRGPEAAAELAGLLAAQGFGETEIILMEALGGPRERIRKAKAAEFALIGEAPLLAAFVAEGAAGLPRVSGLPDEAFLNDGQITKRPIRALTLSSLAPRPGERLWDVGAGSGSISVEWLLAAPGASAFAVEANPRRLSIVAANAEAFGLRGRLSPILGAAPEALAGLPDPDAVFLGGGASEEVLSAIWARLPKGGRLVGAAVTLETEALFTKWAAEKGGSLMRIEISEAEPLGSKRGWRASRPVIHWSVAK